MLSLHLILSLIKKKKKRQKKKNEIPSQLGFYTLTVQYVF